MPPFKRLLAVAALLAVAVGCTPTCEQTCRKVLNCEMGDAPRLALTECRESCNNEETLYDGWEDTDLKQKLREQQRCLYYSTCEEIEDGVCYDDDLYVF